MFELNLLPITGVLPISHTELLQSAITTANLEPAPSLGVIPETGALPPKR